jgi:ABC-type sugar transport system, periplasmic component
MKKNLQKIIAIGLMLSVVGITGCGKSKTASTDSKGQVTVKLGIWPQDGLTDQIEQHKKWAADILKTDNVKIEPSYYKYAVDSFVSLATAGNAPTIFDTWYTEPQKLIDNGFVRDITPQLKELGWDTKMNPDVKKLLSKDGKIYGLPRDGYAEGLMINAKLFKDAGLADANGKPIYPKTWDELAKDAKIIKDKTGHAGIDILAKDAAGGWLFTNIAWDFGAQFEVQKDSKWTAQLNSKEAIAAMQYVKDLKWKYDVIQSNILSDVNDMFKLFGTDQVGMTFGLTDWISVPVTNYKMSKDNMAMSPLPAGPKGAVSLLGGSLFMFSPNSTPEQLDAAFKWLEIIGYTTKTSQDALDGLEKSYKTANEQGQIVGPTGLQIWANSERLEVEKAIVKKYTNVNMDLWTPFTTDTGNTIRPEEPLNCQELYQALDAVVQAVLTDKNADPKKMLDRAVEDFQKNYLDKANQ